MPISSTAKDSTGGRFLKRAGHRRPRICTAKRSRHRRRGPGETEHLLAEISFQLRRLRIQGSKHGAVARRDADRSQPVLRKVEFGRHAAHALHAVAEGHAHQPAVEVVGPLVVWAPELAHVATLLLANLDAAVRTAVEEPAYDAVLAAHHENGLLADPRALPVAGLRDLAFEGEVIPGRARENALELAPINVFVGVDPVGHARVALCRPSPAVQCFLRSA